MTSPSPSDALTGGLLRDAIQNRIATADLIRHAGRLIDLWRAPTPLSDGAGGRVAASSAAAPLGAVKRAFTRSLYEPLDLGNGTNGTDLHEKFILIGPYTDDIRPGDYFFVGGKRYIVQFVHDDRTYQVKAEGEVANGGF